METLTAVADIVAAIVISFAIGAGAGAIAGALFSALQIGRLSQKQWMMRTALGGGAITALLIGGFMLLWAIDPPKF